MFFCARSDDVWFFWTIGFPNEIWWFYWIYQQFDGDLIGFDIQPTNWYLDVLKTGVWAQFMAILLGRNFRINREEKVILCHIHILYPRGTCIVEWFAVVSLPQSGMAIRIWGTNSWRRKTGASWRPVVLKRISRLWSRGGRVHQGASTIDILDKDGIRWFEMVWDGLKWYKMVWDGLRWFEIL